MAHRLHASENSTIAKGKHTDDRFAVELPTGYVVTSTQPRHTTPIPIPHSQEPERIACDPGPSAVISYFGAENTPADLPAQLHELNPFTNGPNSHTEEAIFGTSTGNSAHRHRAMANTNALTKYEADLTDQDRAKQKEAVRKYLAERVKSDWKWQWPQPEVPPGSRHGSTSVDPGDVSDVLEEQWKERDEWLSNTSDGEGPAPTAVPGTRQDSPGARDDPFCFGSPESIGTAIRKLEMERKRRRQKRLAEEMVYNDGLRCFVQRRDAWTGARQVSPSDNGLTRPRTKRSSIYSLLPGRSSPADAEPDSDAGLSRTRTKRSSIHSILPGRGSHHADSEPEAASERGRATQIPIAAPILPAKNAMRASITPGAYNTIYDKVILQQLTPSCPMNLKDVTRSCVQGWKRDGEWPPKSSTEPAKKKGRRLSFVSLFSLEKNEEKEKGENVAESAKGRPETLHDEGHEKTCKRPSATIGKGIRKMMFWKERHDSHGGGGGPNGHDQGRTSPAI